MNEEQSLRVKQTPHEPHVQGDRAGSQADLLEALREYARQKPEVLALGCLGIGFVLGWKLKIG